MILWLSSCAFNISLSEEIKVRKSFTKWWVSFNELHMRWMSQSWREITSGQRHFREKGWDCNSHTWILFSYDFLLNLRRWFQETTTRGVITSLPANASFCVLNGEKNKQWLVQMLRSIAYFAHLADGWPSRVEGWDRRTFWLRTPWYSKLKQFAHWSKWLRAYSDSLQISIQLCICYIICND